MMFPTSYFLKIHRIITITSFIILLCSYIQDIYAATELAEVDDYVCDESINFILNVQYHQISLTDGCSNNVCNANPRYVPEYATTNDMDAASEYCKARCNSALLFNQLSGLGNANSDCSICTGFFFQRHTNGHEICGFYTIDLNDEKLDKIGHGHTPGSRVCIKKKLLIKLPISKNLTNPNVVVNNIMTNSFNWHSCGVEEPIILNHPKYNNIKELTFKYDVSEGPKAIGGLNRNVTVMTNVILNKGNVVYGLNGWRRRRLTSSSTSSCTNSIVGVVASCISFTCASGTKMKDYPEAYCNSTTCTPSECCINNDNSPIIAIPINNNNGNNNIYNCDINTTANIATENPNCMYTMGCVDLNSSCTYQKSNELDTYGCKKYGSCGKVVCENPICMYTMGCVDLNSSCTYQKSNELDTYGCKKYGSCGKIICSKNDVVVTSLGDLNASGKNSRYLAIFEIVFLAIFISTISSLCYT